MYMYVYLLQSQLATTCKIWLEELFKPTTVQASLFYRLDARHMLLLFIICAFSVHLASPQKKKSVEWTLSDARSDF